MTYLLDTNTCIRYLNGRAAGIRQRLASLQPDDIAVCSVVKAEMYFGALKSSNPGRSLVIQRLFLDQFASYSFDDRAAEIYGNTRAQLERRGTPIGPNDLLIQPLR
jgi:tRNA(fMet)-specific endonuclease VapC